MGTFYYNNVTVIGNPDRVIRAHQLLVADIRRCEEARCLDLEHNLYESPNCLGSGPADILHADGLAKFEAYVAGNNLWLANEPWLGNVFGDKRAKSPDGLSVTVDVASDEGVTRIVFDDRRPDGETVAETDLEAEAGTFDAYARLVAGRPEEAAEAIVKAHLMPMDGGRREAQPFIPEADDQGTIEFADHLLAVEVLAAPDVISRLGGYAADETHRRALAGLVGFANACLAIHEADEDYGSIEDRLDAIGRFIEVCGSVLAIEAETAEGKGRKGGKGRKKAI